MPLSISLSFDKDIYAPGEQVIATVNYETEAAKSFDVNVVATAFDPQNPHDTAATTGTYRVQPTAPPYAAISLSDDRAGEWLRTAEAPKKTTFTQSAPSSAPLVPSGFGGAEPPANIMGASSFSWMGYTWEIENWGQSPGRPSGACITTNQDGHLILSAKTIGGAYRGGEINSARGDRGLSGNTSTWGYGKYRWVIGTDLSTIPSPLVLGLFTYWSQSKGGPEGQKEIDVELSDWGNHVPPFLQFGFYQDTGSAETAAVPPTHCLTDGAQVPTRSSPKTTVEFEWMPTYITWNTWYGTDTSVPPDYTLTARQGDTYDYVEPYGGNHFAGTVEIPATGGQQVIANLWSYGDVVTDPFEVVLESFTYTPSS